jgi:hypothetical protein
MATATLEPSTGERWFKLTSSQSVWVLSQLAVLLGAAVWQFLSNRSMMQLLWTEDLGIRMAVVGLLLVAVNFTALLGGCHALNVLAASRLRERPGVGKFLQGALYALCFVFCYIPVLCVLLIGPAAVSIQKSMLLA